MKIIINFKKKKESLSISLYVNVNNDKCTHYISYYKTLKYMYK